MRRLLESVPNFSEGRRPDVVQQIVAAASSVEGVHILDLHSDADHNRSVLTLAGDADAVQEAVFRAAARASELIDLRAHRGEHPRIGATDVVPFIPIGAASMADAIEAAQAVGTRIAEELKIPVYFYEESATTPERRNLEKIRGKGFEELRDSIRDDASRRPDLGPSELHESAGATVVGARGPLIAYNIYLNTPDVSIAKAIAKTIRYSSGGLRYVKALGLDIPARNQAQVSMNLTNFRKTGIHTVFALVRDIAESYGVSITDSEVVGLIPQDALIDAAKHHLRLHSLDPDQILENRLMDE
jgi:glutamate formiminotransferase / formiminotetrahydrofolate cyclodeaminase